MSDVETSEDEKHENSEPAWTFRGFKMSGSDLSRAMTHLYRGEVQRSNTWRRRLDETTNWAVVTTAAALTFAFGQPDNPHAMIILTTLLVSVFLYIESRRYRYYELWASRVRRMETDFFASMLVPPYKPDRDWARNLADSLHRPDFPISELEAVGRRFRRNYLVIFLTLALAWIAKVTIHPEPVQSWPEFVDHAGIGPVPGGAVILAGALFNASLFAIGWLTTEMQEARGEVLSDRPSALSPGRLIDHIAETAEDVLPKTIQRVPGKQQLAYIITERGERLSERLLHDLRRGVTGVDGKGMYSGDARTILLCAVAPKEVVELKRIVHDCDEDAFVILTSAQDVMGKGFAPIQEEQTGQDAE